MKWRALYLLAVGLVLAGIVHIAIVLLIPSYGTRGAWAYLSGRTDLYSFTRLEGSDRGSAIAEIDPFFAYGICRFDLEEAGLKLAGPAAPGFWSASVFDDAGALVYSLNNRTAIDGRLDMLVVSPLLSLEMREAQIDNLESSIIIEASVDRGFVVLRLFEPDESWRENNRRFLDAVACERFSIGS